MREIGLFLVYLVGVAGVIILVGAGTGYAIKDYHERAAAEKAEKASQVSAARKEPKIQTTVTAKKTPARAVRSRKADR